MHEIARCESNFRQYGADGEVLRGRENPSDIGIFQINTYYHLKNANEMGLDIFTTEGNVAYALALYESAGTTPWNWSKGGCWGKYET